HTALRGAKQRRQAGKGGDVAVRTGSRRRITEICDHCAEGKYAVARKREAAHRSDYVGYVLLQDGAANKPLAVGRNIVAVVCIHLLFGLLPISGPDDSN